MCIRDRYLALGEIYHLLSAPIPRNATRKEHTVCEGKLEADGHLTLYEALSQENYSGVLAGELLQTTIHCLGNDSQFELIPVHSPLLRESHLVSFPPLTYMLKFSG